MGERIREEGGRGRKEREGGSRGKQGGEGGRRAREDREGGRRGGRYARRGGRYETGKDTRRGGIYETGRDARRVMRRPTVKTRTRKARCRTCCAPPRTLGPAGSVRASCDAAATMLAMARCEMPSKDARRAM